MTWFPDWRRGTREQVQSHDEAARALRDNAERERKAGIRDETPEYQVLNRRVNELRRPLSPVQRSAAAVSLRSDLADLRRGRGRRRSR